MNMTRPRWSPDGKYLMVHGVANEDRVYFLRSVTLPGNQDVTANDVKIYFDPAAGIDQGYRTIP